MISYCPIDEEPPPIKQIIRPPSAQPIKKVSDEDTECNYLVMFFVLGVVVLSITDNISK